MKTSKVVPTDNSSSRRAQPLRQTRTNPPRSSIPGARTFGSRGSLSGGLEEKDIEIFPAIKFFADTIDALPKELVRHFTLLKEVDAKIFAPEEHLHKLVAEALDTPPPQPVEPQPLLGPTSAPMSKQNSINGSVINGGSAMDIDMPPNPAIFNAANVPRRQIFQNCAITMQNMLVSLDEKNHVISTAAEALNKQLARIDDCFPYLELEFSEEARYGSTTHWAYVENRASSKAATGGASRRDLPTANTITPAAQLLMDEAAARTESRKQAMLEKRKNKGHPAESDFDDQDGRHKEKKLHGNAKSRKTADATALGLGITNGATNGHAPKRRKVEKGPAGGAVMERSLSGVFGSNGTSTKAKAGSPRGTPGPDGPKKRVRATNNTNGKPRQRNNATASAMSPSLASSPVRSTFPDAKVTRVSPPTNGRPVVPRGRQNSTQSVQDKRPGSAASNRPNGTSTPNLEVAALATGRTISEVKASMKETAANSKEHVLENADQEEPDMVGGLLVGNRKDAREESVNGDGVLNTIVTTKSGRASKPSTPAIPTFPEPARSRSSRNALDSSANPSNKRSHKKGAGAAAQQLLAAQQQTDIDDTPQEDDVDEDGEIDGDEPTYCYCERISFGEMVGCDANDCEREWFHLECVGLKVAPKGHVKWYCNDCKEKLKNKRFGSR